ncbi:hypothetical protein [Reichenbachiella versicolor]|uniref:hypothetical protein n=1 Tax=Reichenbachiella versicolor TaxID=1821036 RepID=UPI000D6E9D12|nr:hypothetical protein [Reichenbachiella versicolor]
MRLIHEAEDGIFELDEEKHIFSITWKDTVSEATVSRILGLAAKAVSAMEVVHWILDRREQDGFTPEARVWIKTRFLENMGIEAMQKTDRMAGINSLHEITEITSDILMESIKKINPDIVYHKFESPILAQEWVTGNEKKTNSTASTSKRDRIKNIFKRN